MPYLLGAVKSHVKAAADTLGPKYGFGVIYGYRPVGSVPSSDHPKGLALDFMTSSKAKGDALVSDLIANAGAYGVKYIIWWDRVWQSGTWKEYTATSNPHYDHVHVSFNAAPGSGGVVNVGLPNPLDVLNDVKELVDVFRDINRAMGWITNPNNWKRIGLGAAALLLFVFALFRWDDVVGTVKKVSTKVGKLNA